MYWESKSSTWFLNFTKRLANWINFSIEELFRKKQRGFLTNTLKIRMKKKEMMNKKKVLNYFFKRQFRFINAYSLQDTYEHSIQKMFVVR